MKKKLQFVLCMVVLMLVAFTGCDRRDEEALVSLFDEMYEDETSKPDKSDKTDKADESDKTDALETTTGNDKSGGNATQKPEQDKMEQLDYTFYVPSNVAEYMSKEKFCSCVYNGYVYYSIPNASSTRGIYRVSVNDADAEAEEVLGWAPLMFKIHPDNGMFTVDQEGTYGAFYFYDYGQDYWSVSYTGTFDGAVIADNCAYFVDSSYKEKYNRYTMKDEERYCRVMKYELPDCTWDDPNKFYGTYSIICEITNFPMNGSYTIERGLPNGNFIVKESVGNEIPKYYMYDKDGNYVRESNVYEASAVLATADGSLSIVGALDEELGAKRYGYVDSKGKFTEDEFIKYIFTECKDFYVDIDLSDGEIYFLTNDDNLYVYSIATGMQKLLATQLYSARFIPFVTENYVCLAESLEHEYALMRVPLEGNTIYDPEENGQTTEPTTERVETPVSAFEYEIVDGIVTITGLKDDKLNEIIIPEKIEGYPVISIADEAFLFCENLRSIDVSQSVTYIGDYAFCGCGFANIKLPQGLTHIGEGAFDSCENLESIQVPQSVIYIGEGAFEDCIILRSVEMPKSLDYLGEDVFCGCCNLESIEIPQGVTSIGYAEFSACDSLVSIKIPQSVTYIDEYIFGYETDQRIKIAYVEKGSYAEEWAKRNADNIYIRDDSGTEYETPASAFEYEIYDEEVEITGLVDKSLTELVIPEEILGCPVAYIGRNAFYGCISLETVVIPSSVEVIDSSAFEGCSALESIEIPANVMEIGGNVFAYCESLKEIRVDESNVIYTSRDINGNECNAIIDKDSYDLLVGCANTVIPTNVEEIRAHAFNGCSSLKSIVIPESVEMIGWGAFSGCSSLESIVIPASVKTIDTEAFSDCSSFKSIVIPASVEIVHMDALSGCHNLTVSVQEGSYAAMCLNGYEYLYTYTVVYYTP